MKKLKYKNFTGIVNFSEEDNVFFGKIENINALVTFEGNTELELEKSFKESVLHYLKISEIKGINLK